jgi:diguanylate cyclase (GGDEF)-like protein
LAEVPVPAERRRGGEDRPAPRLTRRFALYAGLALVVATAAAFLFVRHYAVGRAESEVMAHTSYVAESVLPGKLRRSDFARPVSGARLRHLDRIARRQLLTPGILRAKLYAPDGTVVYSTEHGLIGTNPDGPEETHEVMAGETIGDVSDLDAEGGGGPDRTVLESYVPVGVGGAQPVGVLEMYADYAPIASEARAMFVPLTIGVAVLLLGLYLSFFPILRRVTATLRRQVAEIEHKAYHDDLTGLPNRNYFRDRVAAALGGGEGEAARVAVMLVDLDRFKEVNDTLGHESGDILLRAIAGDLRRHLADRGAVVTRLGGDEFGVIAVGVDDPEAVLAEADEIRSVLARPRSVAGLALSVDAGIGVAVSPDHGTDAETLLRHAEIAMYWSKQAQGPALYECERDDHSPERLTLVAELRRAIARRELVVHYQPQCHPDSGELVGVEALVRWQHPKRGLLMPDEFVPVAEQTGLIRELTTYVLDEALRRGGEWRARGDALTVAVNISARDLLDCRFPEEVESILRRRGVDAEALELELTEKSALSDLPTAGGTLAALRELGVGVAIDDFGTGNTSLTYLRQLPVDALKIDRSFVMRMLERDDDAVIVRSTIQLAHSLGLRVVAEGVEDAECARRLAELGCDVAQGYHFGRAVAAEEISSWAPGPAADPEPAPAGP